MINILSLEDYIEYLDGRGSVCCSDPECPTTRDRAEYLYSDFCVEQIYFVRSRGKWFYRQTYETGGYNEEYDIEHDYECFFTRCVCLDAQFSTYKIENEKRVPIECPHCWAKKEEEE